MVIEDDEVVLSNTHSLDEGVTLSISSWGSTTTIMGKGETKLKIRQVLPEP